MLTVAQQATLKANIDANSNTVMFQGNPTAIKDLANYGETADLIAAWYNQEPATAYWVWKDSLLIVDVYDLTSDTTSTWNWATYKGQAVPEQNAWLQMFMGGNTNFGHVNNRSGVQAIFGGSSPGNAQRDHILAIGRRHATNVEKVLAIAVTSPPANTGNDGIVGNRGKTTNPDALGFAGSITGQDIYTARGGL